MDYGPWSWGWVGGGRRAEGGGGEKVGYSSATLSPPE